MGVVIGELFTRRARADRTVSIWWILALWAPVYAFLPLLWLMLLATGDTTPMHKQELVMWTMIWVPLIAFVLRVALYSATKFIRKTNTQ